MTAASRAITRACALDSAGKRSAVTSPLPKSSANARRASARTLAGSGNANAASVTSCRRRFRFRVRRFQALDDRIEGAVDELPVQYPFLDRRDIEAAVQYVKDHPDEFRATRRRRRAS